MLGEFWTQAARMTTCGLLVAAAAVPVGLVARSLRPKGEPLLPRWKPWRVPWGGLEVFAVFIAMAVIPALVKDILTQSGFYQSLYGPDFPMPNAQSVNSAQTEEAATVRSLWTGVISLPLLLGASWLAVRMLYSKWQPALAGRGSLAGKVRLAVLAWLVITPLVLVFNAAVTELFKHLGGVPDEHGLTKLGRRPPLDQALFVLEACLAAPLLEELFFRGILLPWCVARTTFLEKGVLPATAARPWFVMAACVVLILPPVVEGKSAAPLAFAVLLAVGLAILWRFTHTGARRARAVYATAALFAIVHSSVWPSPIPLFVLGLALGWLAVRTNGILVPVIVHGLFNAVSALFVLRNGAG